MPNTLWEALQKAVQTSTIPAPNPRIIHAAGIDVDLTLQHWSDEIASAAAALLKANNFEERRTDLLTGGIANPTEHRAAWHTALRSAAPNQEISTERQRVADFVRLADAERRWRNVIHIGIGGSDWGVRLAISAFGYAGTWRNIRFAANIDGHAMAGAMAGLDPRDTLVVVASKSFTTSETLQNAQRAIEWLQGAGIADPYQHIVAITARPNIAATWGAHPNKIFKLWDWVGGRFSLWSSVGLTVALAVGNETIAGMHAGAAAMDQHFATAAIPENAPVQMALAGVINRNMLSYGTQNIAPYDFRLGYLVPYLQQLEMESLGKSVDVKGKRLSMTTGPVVWGMPGTDAQHTFFQWLHQSNEGAPVDFIACQDADHQWLEHHISLLANCLAQREALLKGKTILDASKDHDSQNAPTLSTGQLALHRTHPGKRPSTLLMLRQLTPYSLGALVALYEHKIFVQGVLWNINPFDQWGVEFGKQLAKGITTSLRNGTDPESHDISTSHWIQFLQQKFSNKNNGT